MSFRRIVLSGAACLAWIFAAGCSETPGPGSVTPEQDKNYRDVTKNMGEGAIQYDQQSMQGGQVQMPSYPGNYPGMQGGKVPAGAQKPQ